MQSHMSARLAAGLLLVSTLITPTFAVHGTVNAGGDNLRVRAEATTQSAILDRLPDGTQVEIVDAVANGDWYKIVYGGISGYVSSDYMTLDLPAPAPAAPAPAAAAEVYAKVDCSSLNVRTGPDTAYDKVGSLKSGRVVKVLDQVNGWYQIEEGYISAKYTVPATAAEYNAPASKGQAIVDYAMTLVGSPYVYGGSSAGGFDCSGFTSYVYRHFGYSLNRSSAGQTYNGVAVSRNELQPGDLMFFQSGGRVSHVGIYVGGNRMIHASTSRTGVIVSDLNEPFYRNGYTCARRIVL